VGLFQSRFTWPLTVGAEEAMARLDGHFRSCHEARITWVRQGVAFELMRELPALRLRMTLGPIFAPGYLEAGGTYIMGEVVPTDTDRSTLRIVAKAHFARLIVWCPLALVGLTFVGYLLLALGRFGAIWFCLSVLSMLGVIMYGWWVLRGLSRADPGLLVHLRAASGSRR
jgi:hypothetical protein